MEDSLAKLTKAIDESRNPNFILVRLAVDNLIYEYKELYEVNYEVDERNQLILDIYISS